MKTQYKKLILRGKATVFIDWANVYGWEKTLKRSINPKKLYDYLKTYTEVIDIRFYFGEDAHPKSKKFLSDTAKTGYKIITKPVKYILVAEISGQKIYRRKCDFDMEACIDVHKVLNSTASFIFFTGDGDYEPLYKLLIELGKQVIVVYTPGHLGREIQAMKKGIFKVELENLMDL
ncbi:MAG: NYN domain-containing protein [bacterium]|nr:NYN domain-containing protein [bacterium]